MDAALDAVITIDESGVVVEVNRATERIFGYERSQALGRPVADLVVPPRLRAAQREGLRRVVAGGPPRMLNRRVEVPALRADGAEFPVEMTVTRTGDNPTRFTAWIRDLTEPRAADLHAAHGARLTARTEEVARMGSWEWAPQTGELHWSDNLFRLYGFEPQAVVPTIAWVVERTHPDDREALLEEGDVVARDGSKRVFEYRIQRPDGVGHMRSTVLGVEQVEGEPRRVMGTVQDITEMKQADHEIEVYVAEAAAQEKHRRTLEHRLQEVIDGAPMPIYAKDRSFQYLVANRRAHQIAQLEPDGLIGLRDESIMPPEAVEHARASDRLVLEQGKTFEEEQTLIIRGRSRTYLTVKFPLLDDDGEVYAVCGISTEITGKKQAERLRDELASSQARAIVELRTSRLETVERLAKAVELRDAATGGHVGRIGDISALLAEKLGLDPDRIELMRSAAPMHDVGKIGIADEILLKPGSLTNAERRAMRRHAMIGHDLLADSQSELLRLAATIARTHHERFDGSGYPSGITGEEIPLEGRIVAVADVFDALLSDRSYRPALPLSEALEIMRAGRGSHFDPAIADLLLENLDEVLSVREPREASGPGVPAP